MNCFGVYTLANSVAEDAWTCSDILDPTTKSMGKSLIMPSKVVVTNNASSASPGMEWLVEATAVAVKRIYSCNKALKAPRRFTNSTS